MSLLTRRLSALALVGILALTFLVVSPIKGSALHPQNAAACGTWRMSDHKYTDIGFFDYYYYQNTFARFGVEVWTNDCSNNGWQWIVYAYVDNTSPATFRLDFDSRLNRWYQWWCGSGGTISTGSTGNSPPHYRGTFSYTSPYFSSDWQCPAPTAWNWYLDQQSHYNYSIVWPDYGNVPSIGGSQTAVTA